MKKTKIVQTFVAVLMISALLTLPAFAGTLPGIQPRENSGAGADGNTPSDSGLTGDTENDGSGGIFGEDSGAKDTDFGDTSNADDSGSANTNQGGTADTANTSDTGAGGSAGENSESVGDGKDNADSGTDSGINTESGNLSGEIADGDVSDNAGTDENPDGSENGARWLTGLLAVVAAAAVIGLSVALVPKRNRSDGGNGSQSSQGNDSGSENR